jgi:hypothetical protein
MSIPVRVAGQRWRIYDPEDDATIIVEIVGAPGEQFRGSTTFKVLQIFSQKREFYKVGQPTDLGFSASAPWVYELLEGQEKPL